MFGRGAEEALALVAAGIPFEIVPGVTAGVGVTAYAGIPVTHRAAASAVAFVTGHGDPESETDENRLDWPALARFPGTLVIYMGVTHLAAICRTLVRLGKPGDTPAAVIESGTLACQQTVTGTLATIALAASRAPVRPPALLVIGSVAGLRDELNWFERLPLFGQRIVVTRPRDEGHRAAVALEALGAEVLLAPTVLVRPISDPAPLDAAIDRLASYDWLVFTSANGVEFFLRAAHRAGTRPAGPGTLEARRDRSRHRGSPGRNSPQCRSRARDVSLGGAGGGPARLRIGMQNPAGARRSWTCGSQG